MTHFLIAYDLADPAQDYEAIDGLLKELGAERVLRSTWALKSDLSGEDIFDVLKPAMDINHKIVIAGVTKAVSFGLTTKISD